MNWRYQDNLHFPGEPSQMVSPQSSSPTWPGIEPLGITGMEFLWANVLHAILPKVSMYWRKPILTNLLLEAKDVLPNTNRTQVTERAEKCSFLSVWHWPLTLTFKLVQVRDQTRLPCKFVAVNNNQYQWRSHSHDRKKEYLGKCNQLAD